MATDPTLDVDVTTLNPADRDFLRVLDENDGEADTTTLRNEGALTRDQVHHRYDSLAERGLIAVDRVGDAADGRTSNTARLTDRGEQLVASGSLDEIARPNANLEALRNRLDTLETVLSRETGRVEREVKDALRSDRRDHQAVTEMLEERIGNLEAEVGALKKRMDDYERTSSESSGRDVADR